MSVIPGHFIRIRTTWTAGGVLPSEWSTFDQECAQAINGDDGGCWAPTTPITITGSTNGLYTGKPVVVWGSSGTLTSTGTSRYSANSPAALKLSTTHAGRSRNLGVSMLRARSVPWQQLQPALNADGTFHGEMQTVSFATQAYNATSPTPTMIVAPLEVHNGGTISAVTFSFAVNGVRTSVPTTMPKARILRVDTSGNSVALTSTASGGDANGWVSAPTPSTAAAYYNSGAFQTFTVPCDQNNVADTSAHFYVAEIVEEQNGSVTPILQPVDLVTNFSAAYAVSASPGTIDGVSVAVGMRVLFKDQSYPARNGIYVYPGDGTGLAGHLGTPFRAPDMPFGGQPVNGTQIPVKSGGAVYGGAMVALSFAGSTPNIDGSAVTWTATTAFPLGSKAIPTRPNGFVYAVTTAGSTAANEPSGSNATPNAWPTTPGVSITDGTVVWQCQRDTSTPLYFGTIGQSGTAPPAWSASTTYTFGALVSPTIPNGFVYAYGAASGTSGATEPTWPTRSGVGVLDNGAPWLAVTSVYNAALSAQPLGNVWGDTIVQMTNIPSLAFQ